MNEDYPLGLIENDDSHVDCEIFNEMFFFRDNGNIIKEQLIGKQEKEENIYKNVPEKVTAHTENEEILEGLANIYNLITVFLFELKKCQWI